MGDCRVAAKRKVYFSSSPMQVQQRIHACMYCGGWVEARARRGGRGGLTRNSTAARRGGRCFDLRLNTEIDAQQRGGNRQTEKLFSNLGQLSCFVFELFYELFFEAFFG